MAGPTDTTRAARKRARPHLLAALQAAGSLPCPRCPYPMYIGQRLHVGHTIDVVDGGADSPLRLEHAVCNQRAGDRRRSRSRKPKLIKRASVSQRLISSERERLAAIEQRAPRKIILPTGRR